MLLISIAMFSSRNRLTGSGLPSFSNSTEHLAEDWLCCQQMGEFSDQRL